MEIFNVGPLELLFIIILAFIVIGPKNTVQYAQKAGKKVNEIIKSPLWSSIVKTSNEIRSLPRKLIQDTGVEEAAKEIETNLKTVSSDFREKYQRDGEKTGKPQTLESQRTPEPSTQQNDEASAESSNQIADKP
jgi:Sec-independent protein translocase protein TatA